MKNLLFKFAKDESGATAIEYALIAGLLSVAVIAMLTGASTSLQTLWTTIETTLATAAAAG